MELGALEMHTRAVHRQHDQYSKARVRVQYSLAEAVVYCAFSFAILCVSIDVLWCFGLLYFFFLLSFNHAIHLSLSLSLVSLKRDSVSTNEFSSWTCLVILYDTSWIVTSWRWSVVLSVSVGGSGLYESGNCGSCLYIQLWINLLKSIMSLFK